MHLVQTMAYAGEKPWHGIGNRLAAGQSIVNADRNLTHFAWLSPIEN